MDSSETLYRLSYVLSESCDASVTYGRSPGCRCACCYEYKIQFTDLLFPGPNEVLTFAEESLESVILKSYDALVKSEKENV